MRNNAHLAELLHSYENEHRDRLDEFMLKIYH